MKRLLLIVLPLLLIVGCEDKDTTPPTVTITSPQDGSTVSGSITITCISTDNEGVEKVELWVNGVTTGVTDDTEPYSLEWNTTLVDNGDYTITIRSYDLSGNTTDSESIVLTVQKPTEVILWGVVYSVENTTDLNLSYNQLTGSIPPEIGNLTNLTSLNLYSNDITGSIPSEIGNLTNLTSLYLSYNDLSGPIPPEIGNLTNLRVLELTNNQLSGEIPVSICDLNIDWGGSQFKLSDNELCPPYPSCIEDYMGGGYYQDLSNCD
jgi:Leucine-rich repeat (LRR) protein